MNNAEDWGYMSLIEKVSDVDNTFLSRRELTCNFTGLGGKLKKTEAVDMISKEFKLDGKVIIPILMKNHVGKPMITGTFFVYDDEKLAKEHVNPTIFKRLEKAQKAAEEAAAPAEEAPTEEAPAADEKKEEAADKEVKAEEKPAEEAKEEKSE